MKKGLREVYELYKQKEAQQGEFFRLKNDRDKAVVRFIFTSDEDVDYYIVHRVEVEGRHRNIICLQTPDCPLCMAGNKARMRLFLQMMQDGSDTIKIWERGAKFAPTILGLLEKYRPIYGRRFEIERFGRAGDMQTSYQIYPLDPDNFAAEKLPQKLDLEGWIVHRKTREEMREILQGDQVAPRAGGAEDIF